MAHSNISKILWLIPLLFIMNGCATYHDAIGRNCLAEANYSATTYQKDTGIETHILIYDTCESGIDCKHAEAFYFKLDGSKTFIQPVYRLGPVVETDLKVDSGNVYNIKYIKYQGGE